MKHLVRAFPEFGLSQVVGSPESAPAFNALYSSGRAAIYWLFKSMWSAERSVALVPAYHCGVEIQAILDAGFTLRYYRHSNDLSPVMADIEQGLCGDVGAILLIHYFGFYQDSTPTLGELARKAGAFLIEDCAHALFSGKGKTRAGTVGEAAAFSLRKTLPIYDGGAVVLNTSDIQLQGNPRRANRALYARLAKEAIKRVLRISGPIDYQFHASARPEEPQFSYQFGCSWLTRRVLRHTDRASVIRARRRNYLLLAGALRPTASFSPVFDELPNGTCPLFLPIWVNDRDELMLKLATEGLETFRFGARPHEMLPSRLAAACAPLRDHILAVPVHQQLTAPALEQLTAALQRMLSQHRYAAAAHQES